LESQKRENRLVIPITYLSEDVSNTHSISLRPLLPTPHENPPKRTRILWLIPLIAPPPSQPYIRSIQAERQATGSRIRQPNIAIKFEREIRAAFGTDDGRCIPGIVGARKALEGEAAAGYCLVIEKYYS
jgi:hypothetical protein